MVVATIAPLASLMATVLLASAVPLNSPALLTATTGAVGAVASTEPIAVAGDSLPAASFAVILPLSPSANGFGVKL